MMRYSVQPGDLLFVEGYEVFSFAKYMGTNIGKNITKNLSDENRQKLVDQSKQSATDPIKIAPKRAIQITE